MADEKKLTKFQSSSKEELHLVGSAEVTTDFELGTPTWDEQRARAYYHSLDPDSLHFLLEKTGHGVTLDEKDHLTPDLLYLLDKLVSMSDDRAVAVFKETIADHMDDVNFPADDWNFINEVVDGQEDLSIPSVSFKARVTATLSYYHSPYPEVRSITDVYNDPEEPCETIRSYVLAIIWTIIGSGVNEFFYHRQPAITLTSAVISVLMYPCGKAWEYVMPNVMVPWLGGKIPLNPGKYSYKEQMFSTLFAGVSGTTVYVTSNIITQKVFYQQSWAGNFGFQILLSLSSQCLGLGFAGIMRKFVIYPSRAVWPTMLPTLALNRALLRPERKELIHGWKISKYNFFWISFCAMFLYFWFPNYVFQALSSFNWINWIAPNNFKLATVTGFESGLGLNPWPTFDWNIVAYVFNPLAIPVLTVMNMFAGSIIGFFIILAVYYSNHKWTAYLPINSNAIFTNTGESFEVTEILTDGLMDYNKYQEYSPPFYTAANVVLYGAFFLVYPLTFFYSSFKEWRTLLAAFRMFREELTEFFQGFTFKTLLKGSDSKTYSKFHDAHSKMMSRYEEVPDMYYVAVLLVSFIFAIICVEVYPEVKTPVWGLVFVIVINFVFLIPFSVLYAVTGALLGLNVLVELIIGYALPGNGVALMTLKAYGYNIDGQAEGFISSLKMGHYAKIPPRSVFRAQITGTIIQAFVSLAVVNWSMSNIDEFCDIDQEQKFSCPQERTFYAASVLWGVIGPKLVFSSIYPELQWCFLIGFGVAMMLIATRYFFDKKAWFQHFKLFEPTLFIYGIINVYAPYNLSYVIPGVYLSLIFMWFIRKRYLAWFEKYNYVLSAALNAGVAFSAVIIFFAVQFHAKNIDWWGNTVSFKGVEGGYGQQSLYNITATARGYFGWDMGHYPEP